MKKILLLIVIVMFISSDIFAQKLKVTSPDGSRGIPAIMYGRKKGHAVIVIESAIKGLNVSTTTFDDIHQRASAIGTQYLIDVDIDSLKKCEVPYLYREVILSSPISSKMHLPVPSSGKEELSEAIYYYTVTLPEKFPTTLSVEWIMNDHIQKGIRIGYGGRYGFMIGGTLGDFRPSGDYINNVTTDCDLTYAKLKGYVRTTIYGGLRIGLLDLPDITTLILNIGLGYGESGRQWENKVHLENSKYFYSDYIKGVDANFSLSAQVFEFCSISCGGDMIMSKGKFTMEWQVGLGVCLNTAKWFKHRSK